MSAVDIKLDNLLCGLVAGHIKDIYGVVDKHYNKVRDVHQPLVSPVHTTSCGPYRCIVHFECFIQQAFDGLVQGCVGGDVMEGQGDVHWILKGWKEPFQR